MRISWYDPETMDALVALLNPGNAFDTAGDEIPMAVGIIESIVSVGVGDEVTAVTRYIPDAEPL